MKKLQVKTESYSVVGSNGCEYIVTVETSINKFGNKEFSAWLNRKNYGIRSFLIGIEAKHLWKDYPYGDFLDIIDEHIEDFITCYEECDVKECDR